MNDIVGPPEQGVKTPPETTPSAEQAEPLSRDDLAAAVAFWLCDTFEDEEGMGCEPEAGPPCIGHFLEACFRLDVTIPPAVATGIGVVFE